MNRKWRMKMKSLLFAFILFIASSCFADTVIFHDGSKLIGDIKKVDGGIEIKIGNIDVFFAEGEYKKVIIGDSGKYRKKSQQRIEKEKHKKKVYGERIDKTRRLYRCHKFCNYVHFRHCVYKIDHFSVHFYKCHKRCRVYHYSDCRNRYWSKYPSYRGHSYWYRHWYWSFRGRHHKSRKHHGHHKFHKSHKYHGKHYRGHKKNHGHYKSHGHNQSHRVFRYGYDYGKKPIILPKSNKDNKVHKNYRKRYFRRYNKRNRRHHNFRRNHGRIFAPGYRSVIIFPR